MTDIQRNSTPKPASNEAKIPTPRTDKGASKFPDKKGEGMGTGSTVKPSGDEKGYRGAE